jgi:hypothetical protein
VFAHKDTYRNCSFILVADCVEDSKDSLSPVPPESKETSLPLRAANGQQVSWWTLSNRQLGSLATDVIFGVLSSRGWTLQQRILAPRILHYGKAKVHWECPNFYLVGEDRLRVRLLHPSILDEAREAMIEMNRKSLRTTSSRNISGMRKGCARSPFWYDSGSACSCRQLTLPEDRLTAILGLADLFRTNVSRPSRLGLCGVKICPRDCFGLFRVLGNSQHHHSRGHQLMESLHSIFPVQNGAVPLAGHCERRAEMSCLKIRQTTSIHTQMARFRAITL